MAQPPARRTTSEQARQKRDEKLAAMQEEIDSGRMKVRQLTDAEMEEHAARRDEVRANRERRKR
jgi:hypothetical protein